MRRFELVREYDVSGVSGTGVVAEGVEFADGTAVLHWRFSPTSTGVYGSVSDVTLVHGHGGLSRVVYLDYKHDESVALT